MPFNDQGAALPGVSPEGHRTPSGRGAVTAYRQTCPKPAPAGAPITASSYLGLARGAVRILGGAL